MHAYFDDESVEALIDLGSFDFVEQDQYHIRTASPYIPSLFDTREDALREALTHDFAYLWEDGRWNYNVRWKLSDRAEFLMMFSPLSFRAIIEEDEEMAHVADPVLKLASIQDHQDEAIQKLRMRAERITGATLCADTFAVTYEA